MVEAKILIFKGMIILFYVFLINAIICLITSIYGKMLLKEKGYEVNWIISMPFTEYMNLKKIAYGDRRYIIFYYILIVSTIIYYLTFLLFIILVIFFREQLQVYF